MTTVTEKRKTPSNPIYMNPFKNLPSNDLTLKLVLLSDVVFGDPPELSAPSPGDDLRPKSVIRYTVKPGPAQGQ